MQYFKIQNKTVLRPLNEMKSSSNCYNMYIIEEGEIYVGGEIYGQNESWRKQKGKDIFVESLSL